MRNASPGPWVNQPSFPRLAVLSVICLGLFFRITQFAANRSLWLDEAALALNISTRTFAQILQPLSYNQGAPLGFLEVQWLLVHTLGDKDYILRLFPLGAAVVALPAMYIVARKYLDNIGGLFALSIFAVCFKLTYYASENKQYSLDVLTTVMLLYVAHNCLADNTSRKDYLYVMLGGVASMWFSHPALFTLTGIGVALMLKTLRQRTKRDLFWFGVIVLAWLLNLLVLYVLTLRSLAANQTLIDYWHPAYMPVPPWNDLGWIGDALLSMLATQDELGLNPVSLVVGVLVVGVVALAIRKLDVFVVLVVPFAAVLFASGLEKYPFFSNLLLFSAKSRNPTDGRFLLFSVPFIFLLLGEGVQAIYLLTKRWPRGASISVIGLLAGSLLLNPAEEALRFLRDPYLGEDIKPVMSYLSQYRSEPSPIFVYYGAEYAFRYYSHDYGFSEEDYIFSGPRTKNVIAYLNELNGLARFDKVWVVFAHNCTWCVVNEENFFVEHLDVIGQRLNEFHASGSSAYLYAFGSCLAASDRVSCFGGTK